MSIKKQYQKRNSVCKVRFILSKEAAAGAKTVHLVGEFNEWDVHANAMAKQKNGSFATTVSLKTGREYQFRYLIDGYRWENDEAADKYAPTSYGDCDNSVVVA